MRWEVESAVRKKTHFCGVSHIPASKTRIDLMKFLMEGAMSTISQEFATFDSRRRLRWSPNAKSG
jgi:hypothetical protein